MLEKHFNDYVTLHDLNELLDSDIAELVRELDSNDGSYDGIVKASVINEWRESKGLARDKFASENVAFIDAFKYIYNVMRIELNQGL